MGERYRLLGGYRGGSDMRVGTLVSFVYYDDLGVIVEPYNHLCWVVHFVNGDRELCWTTELEVICK